MQHAEELLVGEFLVDVGGVLHEARLDDLLLLHVARINQSQWRVSTPALLVPYLLYQLPQFLRSICVYWSECCHAVEFQIAEVVVTKHTLHETVLHLIA